MAYVPLKKSIISRKAKKMGNPNSVEEKGKKAGLLHQIQLGEISITKKKGRGTKRKLQERDAGKGTEGKIPFRGTGSPASELPPNYPKGEGEEESQLRPKGGDERQKSVNQCGGRFKAEKRIRTCARIRPKIPLVILCRLRTQGEKRYCVGVTREKDSDKGGGAEGNGCPRLSRILTSAIAAGLKFKAIRWWRGERVGKRVSTLRKETSASKEPACRIRGGDQVLSAMCD